MYPFYGSLPVPYVPVLVTNGLTSVCLCDSSLQNLTVPHDFYLTSQFLSETTLVTLYSMVGDRRVSKAGPTSFYRPELLAPCLISIVLPFSSFFLWVGIVGLGSSTLSRLCMFNNNNKLLFFKLLPLLARTPRRASSTTSTTRWRRCAPR